MMGIRVGCTLNYAPVVRPFMYLGTSYPEENIAHAYADTSNVKGKYNSTALTVGVRLRAHLAT
jgi:spore maturation protein CgeB